MKQIQSDVLIIGSGISGLTAAILAAEQGLSVHILTKAGRPEESNTYYAQGGIVGKGINDSAELLAKDILAAGSYLNNNKAVLKVTKKGPVLVDEFLVNKIGVPFSLDRDGNPELTKEAAHSLRRIYHQKDETGRAIEIGLLRYAEKLEKIQFFTSHIGIDLITNCHNSSDTQERYRKKFVLGAYALNIKTGEVLTFISSAVILATGGIGNIFQHTSNPSIATGDGIAMAYRAGASVLNAEFVQFHPTTLYHRDVDNFLISESLRGEGAVLINKYGHQFMKDYHSLADLAPRDEVSIAISREMEKTGSRYVRLDATGIKNINLKERFPVIYEKCSSIGIDITQDAIPVVPAAHYFCGGIKVNMDGRTEIEGLYAVGETACTGVHGANRLASVSLLEGLVFSYEIGEGIGRNLKHLPEKLLKSIPDWIFPKYEDEFDPTLIKNDLLSIQTLMWNYTGILRTKKRLNRALSDLNYLSHRIERFYRQAVLSENLIEMRNSVLVATIVTQAALMNTRSVGCHYLQ